MRLGVSAYGKHLFGKVRIPGSEEALFVHFRAFIPGGPETATFHCIRMEEVEQQDGSKVFKAIFEDADPLCWFDE